MVRPPAVRLRLLAAAGLAAAASTLAACGGSSGPSKTAFLAKANSICAEANAAEQKLPKPTANTSTAVGEYIGAVAAVGNAELKELRALPEPSGDKAAIASVLATGQNQIDVATKLGSQFVAGDKTGSKATYDQLNALTAPVNKAFDSYGLKTCGSGSVPAPAG